MQRFFLGGGGAFKCSVVFWGGGGGAFKEELFWAFRKI